MKEINNLRNEESRSSKLASKLRKECEPHWSDFIPGYGIWHARYAFPDLGGGTENYKEELYSITVCMYHTVMTPIILGGVLAISSYLESVL